jgi:hypothetical protein
MEKRNVWNSWLETWLIGLSLNNYDYMKGLRETVKKPKHWRNVKDATFHFGSAEPESEIFRDIFWTVMEELPEEVSKVIWGTMDVLYIFTSSPVMGEVKWFNLNYNLPSPVGKLRVVVFPSLLLFRPLSVIRNTIIHELAHVYLNHKEEKDKDIRKQNEEEADKKIVEWGFQEDHKFNIDYWAGIHEKVYWWKFLMWNVW